MCFGRDVTCHAYVCRDVEQNASVFGLQEAALLRRRGMRERSLRAITQESLRELKSLLMLALTPPDARGSALGLVGAFELVVLRCCSKEVLKFRRLVINWRGIDPDDALVAIHLVPRPELQSGDTLRIDAHQMQARSWHLQRNLLDLSAIAAPE